MIKNLKILFVEDEQNIRTSLKKAIGDEFDQFVTAENGEDGFAKFKNGQFDLIISDISMPKLNGLEMTKKIKEISHETPIILLSAYSDKDKLLQAIEIGISKYMIKPIDPEELLEAITLITDTTYQQTKIIKLQNSYTFDIEKNILHFEKREINLTKKELLFVAFLVLKIGELVSKEKIKNAIWKDENIDDTLIRSLVKRIRLKTHKNFIENTLGLGYKINR